METNRKIVIPQNISFWAKVSKKFLKGSENFKRNLASSIQDSKRTV